MIKLNLLASLFIAFFSFNLLAQTELVENFDDNNFTVDPTWLGDTNVFIINSNGELQLCNENPESANRSQLYTSALTKDSTNWEFYMRTEDFGQSPSSSNFASVYLASSSNDLTGALDGYFIKFGGITGNDDAIELVKQTGTTKEVLISGEVGALAVSEMNARVRVTRDNNNWELLVDYDGGTNFVSQGTATESSDQHELGRYFGVNYRYSTSRNKNFFIDDIDIRPLFIDTEAPLLISAVSQSSITLDAIFNEAVAESWANDESNFTINNGISVTNAVLDATDPTIVHLTVSPAFGNQQENILTANNITDVSGNVTPTGTANFTFYIIEAADAFDILINEIMAAPNPEVALPIVEYIELYNRSDKVIDLDNYSFTSGTTVRFFNDPHLLLPGDYVIVCDDDEIDLMNPFGTVVPLANMQGLPNAGSLLTLVDPSGRVIHSVNYTDDWYQNTSKDDGGWSLELINPNTPCEGASNWRASEALVGGTPGQENSVLTNEADTKNPDLVDAFPNSPTEILLSFSEALDVEAANDEAGYLINNGIEIITATAVAPLFNSVILSLSPSTPLEDGVMYELLIKSNVTDCIGNEFGLMDEARIALPKAIERGDLVINEILFNPELGGVDFLELYNNSNKIVNLGDLIIANLIDSTIAPINSNYLFFPQEYAVLTENRTDILNRYTVENESALIENDLPSFPNDAGNVSIYTVDVATVIMVDTFDYNESFHNALLDVEDGVSLERIDFDKPTQAASNWHSAAEEAGFATPTAQNSQFFANNNPADDVITIPNTSFSPDGDGFEDFLLINYETNTPGYIANVKIFDAKGRLIKDITKNELLAAQGSFKWDGAIQDNTKARIGIYIVWVELFNPSGDVQNFKKTCVLAGRLE